MEPDSIVGMEKLLENHFAGVVGILSIALWLAVWGLFCVAVGQLGGCYHAV